MSTQHAAGPWKVLDYSSERKGFIAVVGSSEVPEHICDVFPFGNRPGGLKRELKQHAANARLIAAAPELLQALQTLVGAFGLDSVGKKDREAPIMKDARAAIARATGTDR